MSSISQIMHKYWIDPFGNFGIKCWEKTAKTAGAAYKATGDLVTDAGRHADVGIGDLIKVVWEPSPRDLEPPKVAAAQERKDITGVIRSREEYFNYAMGFPFAEVLDNSPKAHLTGKFAAQDVSVREKRYDGDFLVKLAVSYSKASSIISDDPDLTVEDARAIQKRYLEKAMEALKLVPDNDPAYPEARLWLATIYLSYRENYERSSKKYYGDAIDIASDLEKRLFDVEYRRSIGIYSGNEAGYLSRGFIITGNALIAKSYCKDDMRTSMMYFKRALEELEKRPDPYLESTAHIGLGEAMASIRPADPLKTEEVGLPAIAQFLKVFENKYEDMQISSVEDLLKYLQGGKEYEYWSLRELTWVKLPFIEFIASRQGIGVDPIYRALLDIAEIEMWISKPEKGTFEKSRIIYESILAAPNIETKIYIYARTIYGMGNISSIEGDITMKRMGSDPTADLKQLKGVPLDAQSSYRKAIENYDRALSLLRKLPDDDWLKIKIMVDKASAYGRLNEFEKSIALCDQVLAILSDRRDSYFYAAAYADRARYLELLEYKIRNK